MSIPLLDALYEDNAKRQTSALFRKLPLYSKEPVVDFSTNSYLALQTNTRITEEALRVCGNKIYGNMASRLISQSSPLYEQLENELADWKGCESALLFNSGYAANTGIIQAVCDKKTEIFCDRLNHASIIDGCILSGAKFIRYRHNDMKHLRQLLSESSSSHKLIITDTVFSMDGDAAPLQDICELGQHFKCVVMVDEAHATGIFGKNASGIVEESGTEEGVHIRVGTLSKAVAGLGGFFAGSSDIKTFLVNNARPLIYSTGLPHSVLAYNIAAVRYIRNNPSIGKTLLEKAAQFRDALTSSGWDCMNCSTQIVPVLTGSAESALELSSFLKSNNVRVPAIRTPTVPKGKERIRFSVHLGIEDEDMEQVVGIMGRYKNNTFFAS
ncbi:MAG: 8-amino-7-oxononanoate synthase [Chitinispirillales bacterium]|jgi:8-amino-7-oxononanoate synthase|nr:8-amino-7-oxononanoate synthase [Chitinispirillales bacterium]